jgi:transposase
MIVLNIIRNKIVSRVFATVNRGTPYVEMNTFLAKKFGFDLGIQFG